MRGLGVLISPRLCGSLARVRISGRFCLVASGLDRHHRRPHGVGGFFREHARRERNGMRAVAASSTKRKPCSKTNVKRRTPLSVLNALAVLADIAVGAGKPGDGGPRATTGCR